MNAGRELDALVAEKVMGWTPATAGTCLCSMRETCHCYTPMPYSTDIAAAWAVMEKLPNLMNYRRIEKTYSGKWEFVDVDDHGHRNGSFAEGDTFPHAICEAALKAVGAL